jgi:hypothetical protein
MKFGGSGPLPLDILDIQRPINFRRAPGGGMMSNQHRQLIADRDHDDAMEPTTPQPRQRAILIRRISGRELQVAIFHWLKRHSITLLRISMGAVMLGFGVLKYFPGVSPGKNHVRATTHLLTLGLVPDSIMMVLIATNVPIKAGRNAQRRR